MNIKDIFLSVGEYMAAGMFEDQDSSVFYRISKGRRSTYGSLQKSRYA